MKTLFRFFQRAESYWSRQSNGSRLGIALGIAFVCMGFQALLVGVGVLPPDPPKPALAAAAPPTANTAPRPERAVRPYLRQNLNDWDSYESMGYSEPLDLGNGAYSVRHRYRAKNGFGATVINDQMFYYSADAGITRVEDNTRP